MQPAAGTQMKSGNATEAGMPLVHGAREAAMAAFGLVPWRQYAYMCACEARTCCNLDATRDGPERRGRHGLPTSLSRRCEAPSAQGEPMANGRRTILFPRRRLSLST